MTKRKIVEKSKGKIYHLGNSSPSNVITNSVQNTNIKEFKTLETPESTSTSSTTSLLTQYTDKQIREKLGEPHPFEYNDIDEILKRFALPNSIVEKKCDFTIGDGIYIESKDEEAMKFGNDWIAKTYLNVFLRPWLKNALAKGSGFLEIAGLSATDKENTIKLINSASMYIKKDENGIVEEFNQFVGKNLNAIKDDDIIKLSPDEVLHLPINIIGGCSYGYGIVQPALQAIDNFLLAQKSIHILTKRKANVPMHVKMGNEEKDDYPSQSDIDGFAQKLSFMDERIEYVTGPNVDIKAIDFGNIGDKFKELLENDYKLLSYSFQTPEILLGTTQGFVGSSEVQMDAYLRGCRATQSEMIFILKEKLFDKIFDNNGFGEVEYNICFNTLSEEEKRKTILSYKELFNSGVSTQMKVQAEKKLAYVLGFEYDEVQAQKEHDQMRLQTMNPSNGNGGQTGRTSDKEIDKTSNGDNGPYTSVSSVTEHIKSLKLKEKYFQPNHLHEHKVSEKIKVSEWLNIDFEKYKTQILSALAKDDFKRLLAENENELKMGYLDSDEILELKDVLGNAIINNKSIEEIKRDMILKMNIKDLTESVKLTAEQRIDMIVKSELTRIMNLGLLEATNNYTLLYKWDAILDEKICPICAELNNKIFDSDTMTQEMLPPIHPNCRCSLDVEKIIFPEEKISLVKRLKEQIKDKLAPQEVELQQVKIKDSIELDEFVKKVGNEYCVFSHQTGKNFGCYKTKDEAEKRLAQIHAFS